MARILGCQAKEPREKALQLTQRDCLNNTLFPNSERNTADIVIGRVLFSLAKPGVFSRARMLASEREW